MKKIKKAVSFSMAVCLILLTFFEPLCALGFSSDTEQIRDWVVLVSLDKTTISMNRGEAVLLTATPLVEGTITWHSSDTSVASVTQYGLVVGVSAGTTYINVSIDTLEYGIKRARCQVAVSASGILTNAVYFVENGYYEQYMGISGQSTLNGAAINTSDLSGHNQFKWIFTLGNDGYYRIRSNYSAKYIRVTNGSPYSGATITQNSSQIDGSKWAIMRTGSDRFALVPASSTVSLVVLNAPGTALNTAAYTDNSNYKDEWMFTRMLPTNGDELTFSPGDWGGEIEDNCNCYAYAINNQVYPGTNDIWFKQQPGEYSYMVQNQLLNFQLSLTESDIIQLYTMIIFVTTMSIPVRC